MHRRLHHEQPDSFAFTAANAEWAKRQIAKYPDGRQASAVIPLLSRGQEQEGWVTRPMIEEVARMLDMAQIRVLEVATFYFMFQLAPMGSVAHVQVCGTTSCMLCGAEDLVAVCRERIAPEPFTRSSDGKFSWEEVECLGACSNAPMVQIGKDYYEDLTEESLAQILDAFARGEVPRPGPQNGRWASEPLGGLTSLTGKADHQANASITVAEAIGDTVRRIDGTEPTASDIALGHGPLAERPPEGPTPRKEPVEPPEDAARVETERRVSEAAARPEVATVAPGEQTAGVPSECDRPTLLPEPLEGGPDDLQRLKGIGPKLESLLNGLGVFHFHQIAGWTDREVAWIEFHLEGARGQIGRYDLVKQACEIVADEGEI